MLENGESAALRLVTIFLRSYADKSQAEFGKAARVDQGAVSRYEVGKQVPSEEALRRMAEAADVPWPVVVHLRRFYGALISAVECWRGATEQGESSLLRSLSLESALLTLTPYFLEEAPPEPKPSPEEERREAEETWQALQRYPGPRRRRLLELSLRARQSWALAERICEASFQAHGADEALELADLALLIAGQVPGEEAWGSRVQGYAWAHLAHARHAAGDLGGAREAFARAWDLWRAGEGSAPGLLAERRLRDLEASFQEVERPSS